MRKELKVLIPLIICVIVGITYYVFMQKTTDLKKLMVSGNIEVTTVNAGFKLAGRVAERLVEEGGRVQQGDLLATLDTVDLQLNVANAAAKVGAAQAALNQLKNGSRIQDVNAAQAALRSARADEGNAKTNYQRIAQLFYQQAVSAQTRDQSETAYAMAKAKADQLEQQLGLVQEGPRQEEIDVGMAQLDQSKQALLLAQAQLSYGQLFSPVTGLVLSKNVEAGEYVSAGTPIVTIGKLDQVWLKAYIPENELGRVKIGQPVTITTDTFPGKIYKGILSFISSEAEFTPKNIQTTEERVKLVYRIKVTIDNPDLELKPGMPADAVIALGGE